MDTAEKKVKHIKQDAAVNSLKLFARLLIRRTRAKKSFVLWISNLTSFSDIRNVSMIGSKYGPLLSDIHCPYLLFDPFHVRSLFFSDQLNCLADTYCKAKPFRGKGIHHLLGE